MREIAPFGIRMPADLKAELLHQAQVAGRSLNQELVMRLRASLTASAQRAAQNGYTVSEPTQAPCYAAATTEAERALLQEFRSLSTQKQLALLALLK